MMTVPVPSRSGAAWERQLPEPSRFWIRYRPRRWCGAAGLWTDLARARLGVSDGSAAPDPDVHGGPALDDVVYIPPVDEADVPARDAVVARHAGRGTPVVVQILPGRSAAPAPAVTVVDPLSALVMGDHEAARSAPKSSVVVWPLLRGLTDRSEVLNAVLPGLAAGEVSAVVPLVLELDAGERRRVAEAAGGEGFAALFHGEAPDDGALLAAAAGLGLKSGLPRPLPRPPLQGAAARAASGLLAAIGDLWLRDGRPEPAAQEFFRAAREIDGAQYDIEALWREGNLGVLGWLEPPVREALEAHFARRPVALLSELEHSVRKGNRR